MALDFTELNRRDQSLETMAREILERKGFRPIRSGRGADRGKDLTLEEVLQGTLSIARRVWVVECKEFSRSGRSVRPKDLGNESIRQKIERNEADAYLLIATTGPSTLVQDNLDAVRRSDRNFLAMAWDSAHLEDELLQHIDILKRYMPDNYESIFGKFTYSQRNLLLNFENVSRELGPADNIAGQWEAYHPRSMRGFLRLSGKKERRLVLRSGGSAGFAVRAPLLNQPLGIVADILHVEFKTSDEFEIFVQLIGRDRRPYYLAYETSSGNPEKLRDGANFLYAKYHIGANLVGRRWVTLERDMNTDLEKLHGTRVMIIEHILFRTKGSSSIRNVSFLKSSR